jgi:hypothetical protein
MNINKDVILNYMWHYYLSVSSNQHNITTWRGVVDTTLCDKVCQWLAIGCWFSPVFSTNKTDSHDINEILLKVKVALNTIN